MADDGMDFEGVDADAVQGGGGYVDDDLDLDDDDDDEPLITTTPRTQQSPSPAVPKINKRKNRPQSASRLPDLKKRKKEAPHPDDYLLRAAGTGDLRDYIVAKFVTRVPDLSEDPHVRLFRNTEPTATARKRAIEADRKQQIYFNSFSGKRRLQRYEKQGIVTIPDRYRNGWTMEVTPQHIYEDQKRREQAQKDNVDFKSNLPGSAGNAQLGASRNETGEIEPEKKDVDPDVDVFAGTFDGKSTSRYAIMVLTEGSKTVDVVPIDEYAWFSFRANRAQGGNDSESTEARMAKFLKKGQNRMSKFQVKYEEAQNIREQGMNDNSRIKSSKEFASFGIQRSRNSKNANEDETKEEMDFEQEFDNDDVAQVDKEELAPKRETRLLGDAEQNAKDFRKMIKDEPIISRPASPGSESDEEVAQGQSSKPPSPSQSQSQVASPSRSPSRSAKSSPPGASRHATPAGATPSIATPLVTSPSPNRSPRGNTPQRLDLSHVLPPLGTLPTQKHVTDVLAVLLKDKQRIPFKELVRYFERKTKEQKTNLTGLLKQVALVTADPVKSKTYFISWKRSRPSGARQTGS